MSCPPSSTRLKSDYAPRTISPPPSLHSPTKRPFAVRRALFWDRCVLLEETGRCGTRRGGIAKEKKGGTYRNEWRIYFLNFRSTRAQFPSREHMYSNCLNWRIICSSGVPVVSQYLQRKFETVASFIFLLLTCKKSFYHEWYLIYMPFNSSLHGRLSSRQTTISRTIWE